MIISHKSFIEYLPVPRKAINIKTALSKNCDQTLDKFDLSQNCFSPIFFFK